MDCSSRPERLRLRGGVLDELDAIHAQRIAGLGVVLAVDVHRSIAREVCAVRGAPRRYFTRFR